MNLLERVRRVPRKERERILSEFDPKESVFFQGLYDGISDLGEDKILKKPLIGRDRQLTLYTPADPMGLYTYRFETAEGGIRWMGESRILAVAYGKRENSDGLVLTGGIHRAEAVMRDCGYNGTDPREPRAFWSFVHEYPGKFMFHGDYFAFRVTLEEDNYSLFTEVSNPRNHSAFWLLDTSVEPIPALSSTRQKDMIQRSATLIAQRAAKYFV